jgi:hypothetical protein
MRLYEELQKGNSEEDVKDAYIKALGLKGHTKGLIDIQSKEIWFEAKHNGRESTYAMFTQWCQIRNAFKARKTSGDFVLVDFSAFETAYKTLGDKLRPQVYELGFLR